MNLMKGWMKRPEGFLLKKHKHSRKQRLIQEKTITFLNRTRWKGEIQEGEQILIAYQWLPPAKEVPRSKYRMKGRGGFAHPYLEAELADVFDTLKRRHFEQS